MASVHFLLEKSPTFLPPSKPRPTLPLPFVSGHCFSDSRHWGHYLILRFHLASCHVGHWRSQLCLQLVHTFVLFFILKFENFHLVVLVLPLLLFFFIVLVWCLTSWLLCCFLHLFDYHLTGIHKNLFLTLSIVFTGSRDLASWIADWLTLYILHIFIHWIQCHCWRLLECL